MRALRRLLNIVIGFVFLISGGLKLMDPVGTGLIMEGYFKFFHTSFLLPATEASGVLFSILEASVGIALVTGVWRRVVAIVAISMLAFFLLISILLVAFNPDMSCGCFGKAIELTHLQTLMKNVVLCVIAVPAFIPIGRSGKPGRHRYVAFWISESLMVAFSVYSLTNIPATEFSEFAVSNTIVTEQDLREDSADASILSLWDENGEDCSLLLTTGKVAAISIYDPSRLDESRKGQLAMFVQNAENAGWMSVLLSVEDLEITGARTIYADYRKLITLNRSNGGVVLLDDGYIIKKYPEGKRPSFDELDALYGEDAVAAYADAATGRSLLLQFFLILSLCVMLFV